MPYDERGEREKKVGGGAIIIRRDKKMIRTVLFPFVVHMNGLKVISKPQKKGAGQLGYISK